MRHTTPLIRRRARRKGMGLSAVALAMALIVLAPGAGAMSRAVTGPGDPGELADRGGTPDPSELALPTESGDPDRAAGNDGVARNDAVAGPNGARPVGPPPLSAVGNSQEGSGVADPIPDTTPAPGVAPSQEYLVLYGPEASPALARALVVAAGGVVRGERLGIGLAWVRSSAADFALKLMGLGETTGIITGVARDRIIGSSAPDPAAAPPFPTATAGPPPAPVVSGGPAMAAGTTAGWAGEPLATTQWALSAIGIPTQRGADGQPIPLPEVVLGRPEVLVGIIDTGIDGNHPDLGSRLDRSRSRNFTVDVPALDGACADEPDASCTDAADVDENGHGTHVAAVVGAAANGFGMAGVAPGVTLVNLRAGQDSGYFFLGPATHALLYAADIGVDVVNLSFFLDPWLYNCTANPADDRAEQVEQATTIAVMQRAVDYARARNVTVVAALGNGHVDLDNKVVDATSPNFPPGDSRVRNVDSACLDVPAELGGVIGVTAVGPSLRKADYANYGLGRTDLAAPGGWRRDHYGTEAYRAVGNEILSAWPEALAQLEIAGNGNELPAKLVEHCIGERCAYYRYLQGTSMAAPHVAGVAALVISRYGAVDSGGQITLDPFIVESLLNIFATERPCPPSNWLTYLDEERPAEYAAHCSVNSAGRSSFYGEGLVNGGPLVESVLLGMVQ